MGDVRFRRFGLPSQFDKVIGDQQYLRKLHGLDVESVVGKILTLLDTCFDAGEEILRNDFGDDGEGTSDGGVVGSRTGTGQ
jgi:hypothetical protein